ELATATATLRRAKDGYQHGINDYLSVLTAQQQQHTASRQLLSSRRQLLSARITLWRALGGDWLETTLTAKLSTQPSKDLRHEK
ncbi:MAG: TolC family protein, partial [Desulfobulbaceae bacterium]|nr:TolC family protein [Desulfobulbaceae bacterium]